MRGVVVRVGVSMETDGKVLRSLGVWMDSFLFLGHPATYPSRLR